MAENQDVVHERVNGGRKNIHPHYGPRSATPGEEARYSSRCDEWHGPETQQAEVHNLVLTDSDVVPYKSEENAREWRKREKRHPADHRYVDALPNGWSDAIVTPCPVILRDKCARVTGCPHKQSHQREIEHTCRHRSRDGLC